jgi:hypothetical protein
MGNDTQKLLKPIARNEAGGVVVDDRGRNVWQWKDAQIDSTSIVLRRLENDALRIEPTRKVRIPTKPAKSRTASVDRRAEPRDEAQLSVSAKINYEVGGGFDPYNHS